MAKLWLPPRTTATAPAGVMSPPVPALAVMVKAVAWPPPPPPPPPELVCWAVTTVSEARALS